VTAPSAAAGAAASPRRAARVSAAILALALAAPAVLPAFADGPRDDRRAALRSDHDDDGDTDDLTDDADSCAVVTDDADEPAPFCDNEVIVRFVAGEDPGTLKGGLHEEILGRIPGQDVYLLRIPPEEMEADVLDDIRADEDVLWAELNYVGNAPQGNPSRFFPRGRGAGYDLAPLKRLKGGATYGRSLVGLDRADCADGSGVVVAVVDTGIDARHRRLKGRVVAPFNAFTGKSDVAAVRDAGDRVNNDGDFVPSGRPLIDEAVGHGTHVAGVVAQVAPGASIMPIKALDSDGSGQAFYLALAIYHAAGAGADVVNLSLGSEGESRAVAEAVEAALASGAAVVAAAGNGGDEDANGEPTMVAPEYPAAMEGVIAVGATGKDDAPAAFSSRYEQVDLSAPGVGIGSAFPRGAQGIKRWYARWSGTSMAAPWVSGAAALLLQRNLAATGVEGHLEANAAPIAGDATGMGAGRLDVGEAVACGQ
jgi:subtilisin family serine protease